MGVRGAVAAALPAIEGLAGSTTDTALAGTHAAAGLQLGLAPAVEQLQDGVADVLAAAYQGVGLGQLGDGGLQGEVFVQQCGKR